MANRRGIDDDRSEGTPHRPGCASRWHGCVNWPRVRAYLLIHEKQLGMKDQIETASLAKVKPGS
jgi:hypothetical protein